MSRGRNSVPGLWCLVDQQLLYCDIPTMQPGLRASIESSIRQVRALAAYRFDPNQMSTLKIPTLLLTGSETPSPQLKQAISGLLDSLPNRTLFVFQGQQHNAMDTVPQQFAKAVGNFFLSTKSKTSAKQ